MKTKIVVMQGDETGQELLDEALRVLQPDVIGMELEFDTYDLSLANRRATHNEVVEEAAHAMLEAGLGLKAATITPESTAEGEEDVGSPNALLRDRVHGTVIVRTGRRIPGVRAIGGVYAPIAVMRMALGDAYGAKEWREGPTGAPEEVAYRTEHITRSDCRAVAEYSFRHARRLGVKVFGGPKYTVSRIYEGMLKEEMDAAAKRHPEVRYEPQLIDATYALLLMNTGDGMVIPALNRDGDCLSDMVLQMFGSIAGAESLLIGFDENWNTSVVMAEAPHGTAPTLKGKNLANPMAMILAGSALLNYSRTEAGHQMARAISESVFEAVYDNIRTADLQGHATTSEFTDEVIRRVQRKREVWAALT